jgi:hypothetical protein
MRQQAPLCLHDTVGTPLATWYLMLKFAMVTLQIPSFQKETAALSLQLVLQHAYSNHWYLLLLIHYLTY